MLNPKTLAEPVPPCESTVSRRQFVATGVGTATALSHLAWAAADEKSAKTIKRGVVIIGGGLGGCSAALAALHNGLPVILTEETDWLGGQLTSQAVPPDEHRWIETHGANASYRELRKRIRDYYRRHYPLTDAARQKENLNPGSGTVSRLCHEPRVALAVLRDWLAPYASSGQLQLLLKHRPVRAQVSGDRIQSITVKSTLNGDELELSASYFIDASELGDVLPLTGTEYVTGAESQDETGELHAASKANAANQQAFTMCFPIEYAPGEDHTIERPAEYDFWKDYVPELTPAWPGRLLDYTYTHPRSGSPRKLGFNPAGPKSDGVINLWRYRQIIDAANYRDGAYKGGVSLVNWPQNDYLLGNLIDVPDKEKDRHVDRAKQLSLSLMYWLQTEAPRYGGGTGHPELRLRGDLVGTTDGIAKYPYVRESRRIRARFTVLEEHVGAEQRRAITGESSEQLQALPFADSVAVGSYAIDLHPSSGGDNYIDFPTLPFQVPLGSLLPKRVENLVVACKNIGVTHVTGGCYRLHPVEWGIGEAAGCLLAFAINKKLKPHEIHEAPKHTADFQKMLLSQGVEIEW